MSADAARLLQICGMLVFVLAGILGLVYLALASVEREFVGDANWARLRTVELFAMLGAVGVIVSVVAMTRNAFVITFGILLIGALIVPTKDMVSFARIAMGRDANNDRFVAQLNDGSELRGRDSDLADSILSKLEDTPPRNGPTLPGQVLDTSPLMESLSQADRKIAVRSIVLALREERMKTNLECVRCRGALNLLVALDLAHNGRAPFAEYLYRFGAEPDFMEDIQTLRLQEMVSYSYGDISGAEITDLGWRVICLHRTGNALTCAQNAALEEQGLAILGLYTELDDGRATGRTAHVVRAVEMCTDRFEALPAAVLDGEAQTLSTPSQLRFSIPAARDMSMRFDSQTTSGDPFLYLLRKDANGRCVVLAQDDDGGEDSNAVIALNLAPGDYVVIATTFSGAPEAAILTITSSEDREVKEPDESEATEEEVALDAVDN